MPALESLSSLGFEGRTWDVPGVLPGCPGAVKALKSLCKNVCVNFWALILPWARKEPTYINIWTARWLGKTRPILGTNGTCAWDKWTPSPGQNACSLLNCAGNCPACPVCPWDRCPARGVRKNVYVFCFYRFFCSLLAHSVKTTTHRHPKGPVTPIPANQRAGRGVENSGEGETYHETPPSPKYFWTPSHLWYTPQFGDAWAPKVVLKGALCTRPLSPPPN